MAQIGKNVRMILDSKSPDVWSVSPDTAVYDALGLMAEKGIGAVLVLEGEEVVGIMSERDYARKIVLKGKSSAQTRVSEIMTENVICVEPSQPIEEIMALMVGKHIRHLPVLENKKLVGIISIGDVVRELISEQKLLIEQLESYIRGY
ncbi:MAG TPA: CBS domain-containing protein [Anaerolineales bacterium]|jgi:CBS domain-containing protein|nr:CBS domain-containing protein [Anaerolineales bacterium]